MKDISAFRLCFNFNILNYITLHIVNYITTVIMYFTCFIFLLTKTWINNHYSKLSLLMQPFYKVSSLFWYNFKLYSVIFVNK